MKHADWHKEFNLYQQRVNSGLENQIKQLPDVAPQLKEAMAYALLNGGKRIRPALVYACGNMLELSMEELDAPAMALECIHTYSLIHDDLPAMDNDELRRGKPTCHVAFSEASAILAGDALQALAFDMLATMPVSQRMPDYRVTIIGMLARASGYSGMCGGQALDLAATDKKISLSDLEALHKSKTGALLQAALLIPAAMAGLKHNEVTLLSNYAGAMGLAFQVQDDILDITGDTQTLGKPQGSDVLMKKSTYPALLGLQGAISLTEQLYQEALQALDALPYNTSSLASFADYIIHRNY
ncbi:(2E,6E)-farnesyl diphosphate synthase [Lacimicrobium alkaliphilum]|uniref:(2E,6E)-farnesyl diphosphate synthase n=1 Tax=Lacimicrobium alkaliphilum TaxID=1526571 RepID=A0ABQ1REU9_9ALTE|nr:(2E,6E)-farnesyl diphosphate synthase [Lacimicrobium alkaliphilum]GGD64726.1 (2E,6E)-farnesyl diphosphate synthase [Lacimicrobium alkaliphilum]